MAATDPLDFAFERALMASTRSSLPLSAAERRAAGRTLLETRPDLTDQQIAGLVGVDRSTVTKWAARHDPDEVSHAGTGLAVRATGTQIAERMFRAIDRVHGLGVAEIFFEGWTSRRLAELFWTSYGGRSVKRARQFRDFLEGAVSILEGWEEQEGEEET